MQAARLVPSTLDTNVSLQMLPAKPPGSAVRMDSIAYEYSFAKNGGDTRRREENSTKIREDELVLHSVQLRFK